MESVLDFIEEKHLKDRILSRQNQLDKFREDEIRNYKNIELKL